MLGVWLRELSELVLPAVVSCNLCGSRRRPGKNAGLCCICQKEIDYWEEKYCQCSVCGRFVFGENCCSKCNQQLPPFSRATAVGPYRGVLKDSLYSLKFRGDRRIAEPLGRLLAQKIRSHLPLEGIKAIVPVPLHIDRLKTRGFNQSEHLAREVGRVISRPVLPNALMKTAETSAQTHLSQKQREANLQGAFCIGNTRSIEGQGVLLIDDIFTTGSTAAECTRVLLQAGAKKVYVGTVATGIQFCPTNHPHPEGFSHSYSQVYPQFPQ